jgi:hypothetical protein
MESIIQQLVSLKNAAVDIKAHIYSESIRAERKLVRLVASQRGQLQWLHSNGTRNAHD